MPFHYLLTNLLVEVPGAVGAIFLDEDGEAVEWVTGRDRDPYDLKVEGAFHAIMQRQVGRVSEATGGGQVELYMVEGSETVTLTQLLPGGYYVVLVMRRTGSPAVAGHHLRRAARTIARELP